MNKLTLSIAITAALLTASPAARATPGEENREALAEQSIREDTRRLAELNQEIADHQQRGDTATQHYRDDLSDRKNLIEDLRSSRLVQERARAMKRSPAS